MKIEIEIPEDLSQITLAEYQLFLKSDQSDERMVEIFCNVNVDLLPSKTYLEILSHLKTIFNEEPEFRNIITIGDTKLGFHPNVSEMTIGEYVDIDSTISDWDTIHEAMAVFYRRIIKGNDNLYEIEKYEPTPEKDMLFKHISIRDVFGVLFFLNSIKKKLMNNFPTFLEDQKKKLMMETSNTTLLKILDGIQVSLERLTETFSI